MTPYTKHSILIVFVLISFFGTAKQPNIIFILADDLGWKDLGIYGSTYYETPNLDKMATQGMRFTNAYSASPVCSPTRASILSGLYPWRYHFTTPAGHLPPDSVHGPAGNKQKAYVKIVEPKTVSFLDTTYFTLGEAFKEAGYKTAYLGKWHVGKAPYLPNKFGFDFIVGARGEAGPPQGRYFSPFLPPSGVPNESPQGKKYPEKTHITEVILDYAYQFVESNKKKPYFLHLSMYDVHGPFQAREEYIQKYQAKKDPQGLQDCAIMGAMIQEFDNQIGRFYDKLKKNGLLENTIIVFYSDNGGRTYLHGDAEYQPTSNLPLRSGKGASYEGSVRVPAFVIWPSLIAQNQLSNEVISSVDLFPTFMEMIGRTDLVPSLVDGTSFLPALKNKNLNRDEIYFHFPHSPHQVVDADAYSAIRYKNWKFYDFHDFFGTNADKYELYNLSKDIEEKNDLADKYPELVAELLKKVNTHVASTKANRGVYNINYCNGFWKFDTKDLHDWNYDDGTTKPSIVKGILEISDNTKKVVSPDYLGFYVESQDTLRIKFQSNTSNAKIKISLSSYLQPVFAEENSFTIEADKANQWIEKELLIRTLPSFNENRQRIKQLQIKQVGTTNDIVLIDEIQFH